MNARFLGLPLLAVLGVLLAALITARPASPRRLVPPKCVVPKVVGLLLPAARTKIAKAHCRVGTISYRLAPAAGNRVLAQSPHRGRRLESGSRVALIVGRGKR
jgi:beta-lactam-binding protein with PASTA domain